MTGVTDHRDLHSPAGWAAGLAAGRATGSRGFTAAPHWRWALGPRYRGSSTRTTGRAFCASQKPGGPVPRPARSPRTRRARRARAGRSFRLVFRQVQTRLVWSDRREQSPGKSEGGTQEERGGSHAGPRARRRRARKLRGLCLCRCPSKCCLVSCQAQARCWRVA